VIADVDGAGAQRAAEELHAGPPGRASAVTLDVRDPEAVTELVEATATDHGHLDLVFNNAGVGIGGEVAKMSLAHFERAVDVNLLGVVHGVLAAYPIMCRQGRGHIVNTASLAGLVPGPGMVPYAMTKHAVVGMSLSLRAEAAAHGVRVSVICPGVIDTPILDKQNPADLPTVGEFKNARQALESSIGKAYPPELLARDVLAGVARNRPLIVAPHHARRVWYVYRTAPYAVLSLVERSFKKMSHHLGITSSETPGSPEPTGHTGAEPVTAAAGAREATDQ
jgi:NAD(P)-dependent dehydrogenase (short-subunit alcohol dehydrogenase family)